MLNYDLTPFSYDIVSPSRAFSSFATSLIECILTQFYCIRLEETQSHFGLNSISSFISSLLPSIGLLHTNPADFEIEQLLTYPALADEIWLINTPIFQKRVRKNRLNLLHCPLLDWAGTTQFQKGKKPLVSKINAQWSIFCSLKATALRKFIHEQWRR